MQHSSDFEIIIKKALYLSTSQDKEMNLFYYF